MTLRRSGHAGIRRLALGLLILLGLSACGQKGDLYLPDGKQASLVRPAHPA